jgi:two-component system nitrogen regulation sensor histidine kinase GlnL
MAVAGRRLSGPAAAELLGALPSAMLVVDPGGIVRDANSAAETLLNLSLAAMQGRALTDLLILPIDYVRRADRDSGFALYDLPLMTTRGHRFRADFVVSLISEHPGWRMMLLHQGAAAHRMGHRLERSGGVRAAIGAAAMLAHEIKNPLSGIRGAAQLIEAGAEGEARALTALIQSEVDRVAALIDRMEDFTDARPLVCAPENIYSILDHVRAVAIPGFARGVTVREEYDPSLPDVMVHRDAMIQVLMNLLKNAVEAAGPDGTVTLTTAYRHGVSVNVGDDGRKLSLPIELCVIDDGPGAPPEVADHLFDPFVSTKKSGRGLGLALVDKLVRDMGGFVQYGREGRPERTVFRLLLPRAPGREAG